MIQNSSHVYLVMNTDLGKTYYNDFTTDNMYKDYSSYPYYQKSAGVGTISESSDLPKSRKVIKEEGKMNEKKGRGLYQVILVDPKAGKIILNEFVICSKVEDVLLEAGASEIIKKSNLQISEVDKIVNYLGEIRKVKKNKDGIVELVEEKEVI